MVLLKMLFFAMRMHNRLGNLSGTGSQIQAVKMSFFRRVDGLSHSDRVRSSVNREMLRVEQSSPPH